MVRFSAYKSMLRQERKRLWFPPLPTVTWWAGCVWYFCIETWKLCSASSSGSQGCCSSYVNEKSPWRWEWGASVNCPTFENGAALWHVSPFSILHVYQEAEIPIVLFLKFGELGQSSKKMNIHGLWFGSWFMLSVGLWMSYHAVIVS